MNLSPKPNGSPAGESGSVIKGSTLAVWRYFLGIANRTDPPTKRFQVSRREIREGARIGSLNTVDSALEDLESYNLLARHPSPGDNEGQVYELLTLEQQPIPNLNRWHIVETFRTVAESLAADDKAMTLQQIVKWSKLTYQARRLMDGLR
jgi:DNA-binding HxlR family transcriptional regulator